MKTVFIVLFSFIYSIKGIASDIIPTAFLKDAETQPVYVYESSISHKIIAEIQEDTLFENWHEVEILKIHRKRFFVLVKDLYYPKGTVIRGWINKEDCAVFLNGRYIKEGMWIVRLYDKFADEEPSMVLTSNPDAMFDDVKSEKVMVTDVKIADSICWMRIRLEFKTGETKELWTTDFCPNIYDSCN